MVEHRHFAYSHLICHLLIRLVLQIAQAEDLLTDGRFKVVDEKQQLFETLVGVFRKNHVGIIQQ